MFDINIVANHSTIMNFKRLKNFKMDLGRSIIDRATKQIKIEDRFLAFMMYDNNTNVNKIGTAGKVSFYYNMSLPNDRIEIYFDTHKYEKTFDYTDIDKWLENNLFEIGKSINSNAAE